jgi:lipopolysaccharide/colanic/teichoic acid biosynthesis glycosyltransferase
LLLWPFIALAIFLSDGRPILFKQTRVGKDGKPFEMMKFRTMGKGTVNTEKPKSWKDKRLIPYVGYVLRITNLDEFPQFINVLKGEMSLVGPRPDTPKRKDFYDESDWEKRTAGHLPGITGRWAVFGKGRIEISDSRAVQMDIQKRTVPIYLFLIIATPFAIARRILFPNVYNIKRAY